MNADHWLATRRSLLARLKDADDHASWQRFFDGYGKLIYGVALKSGLTETEAQDALQETAIAVARHIPEFKYDPAKCSFKTWLPLLTRQRIVHQVRKRHKPGAPGNRVHASDAPVRSPAGEAAGAAAESDDSAGPATVDQIADSSSWTVRVCENSLRFFI